jgi:FkbM family methyltransferase
LPVNVSSCMSSPGELAAFAGIQNVKCSWICIPPIVYCIDPRHKHLPAVQDTLAGTVWEGECKRYVLDHLRLEGTAVAVAGLFFGDWLPPLSRAVGPNGSVFGFEPTHTVGLARATALANQLQNVRVHHACLSNHTSVGTMCVNDGQGRSRGGQSTLIRGGRANFTRKCAETETVNCVPLVEIMPWHSQRVGLLLLDVEGHQQPALDGARKLIERWRPVLALTLFLASAMIISHASAAGGPPSQRSSIYIRLHLKEPTKRRCGGA